MLPIQTLEASLRNAILRDEPQTFALLVNCEASKWTAEEIQDFFNVLDWQGNKHCIGYQLFMKESLFFSRQEKWDEYVEDILMGQLPTS